jgi:hypothetical protein
MSMDEITFNDELILIDWMNVTYALCPNANDMIN